MRRSTFLRMAKSIGNKAVTRLAHPFHAWRRPRAVANEALSAVFVRGMHGHAGMDAETSEFAGVR
jgi:hypothetical protein